MNLSCKWHALRYKISKSYFVDCKSMNHWNYPKKEKLFKAYRDTYCNNETLYCNIQKIEITFQLFFIEMKIPTNELLLQNVIAWSEPVWISVGKVILQIILYLSILQDVKITMDGKWLIGLETFSRVDHSCKCYIAWTNFFSLNLFQNRIV